MKRILITGATGNIGYQIIRFLYLNKSVNQIIAGVRDIDKAKTEFSNYPSLGFVTFDFENPATFDHSLNNIDCIFLLRPPHLSDVDKYFKPLIEVIKEKNIRQVVFLSVQGAEKSKVIPHNKIEKLITDQGLDYIFLRPSYFMQNLTTTLLKDIQEKGKIVLPSAKAKFNWIDVDNIGEVAAIVLDNFERYRNQALEITGYENMDFIKVTDLINTLLNEDIVYDNTSLFRFYRIKSKEGMNRGMIMVMMLLHFLPRFQQEPRISDVYEQLSGKRPTALKVFIQREKARLKGPAKG
ncbi:MAG TPA: NmrA family NAD(P)-binding protein [Prolixibacteraceae bacterium]|nr:NmrA family NAD(P)-binding protein [Prolixibacteraceae bacterium]